MDTGPAHPDAEDFWSDRDDRYEELRDNQILSASENRKSKFENPPTPMGMMKRYLENVVGLCSEEQFGQDAVEWAIQTGMVKLTYNLDADLRTIMGEPGLPETGQYSAIVEAYQAHCRAEEWHKDMLADMYQISSDEAAQADEERRAA